MNKIAEAIRAIAQAMDQRTSLVIRLFEVFVILRHYTLFLLSASRYDRDMSGVESCQDQFSLKDRMFSSFS